MSVLMTHSCFADTIVDKARISRRANSIDAMFKGAAVADRKSVHRDLSIEWFVECQNIVSYAQKLKTEIDPLKRKILIGLLTEEKAKQASHLKRNELNPDRE
jgi:hypothetical protein